LLEQVERVLREPERTLTGLPVHSYHSVLQLCYS
jgi:hypothetical protein